ncbi:MAG: class I SAM-dependent methyltransferase [Gemmatimonadaceae bacterium]|nr:class I SAM-dependent methyltransferase [Gemmatimonadaceae bacterium]
MTYTESTQTYWNNRYKSGGCSGPGSVDQYRDWKWRVIDRYVSDAASEVVDVGCGDRAFWQGRNPIHYSGIDFSEIIIRRNREQWPDLNLICARGEEYQPGLSARVVICMDVLFHVMDDAAYEMILRNITRYSKEWIFIYTWIDNPFRGWSARRQLLGNGKVGLFIKSLFGALRDDGEYQRYRNFSEYFLLFDAAGFKLQSIERNPIRDSFGGLFAFRRK